MSNSTSTQEQTALNAEVREQLKLLAEAAKRAIAIDRDWKGSALEYNADRALALLSKPPAQPTPPADAPTPSPAEAVPASPQVVTDELVTPGGNTVEIFDHAGRIGEVICWVKCNGRVGIVYPNRVEAGDSLHSLHEPRNGTRYDYKPNRRELDSDVAESVIQWADNLPAEPVVTPAPSAQEERVPFDAGTWPAGLVWIRDTKPEPKHAKRQGRHLATQITDNGVFFGGQCVHWKRLAKRYEISTDGGNSWAACTRPAPANPK